MKRHLSVFLLLLPVLLKAQNVIQVNSNITTDTRWTSDNIYELSGTNFIYVTNNATLTIDPGTIVRGNPAALVITRGSMIMAIGTPEQPIVMTSSKPAGQRQAGDWGGLLILGKAKINNPAGETLIEGGIDPVLGKYGGQDDADNSGVLRYVRIEFAGIAFQPNNETNGLTLGGVGNGTDISYVQVSFGGDDAFEWFGGTVNGKFLLAYKTVDDMFDTDFGYRGKNQFLFGVSDPNLADISNSNGFEADNDATGTTNQPQSQAVFSNVTLVGPRKDASSTFNSNFRRAIHLRRSTKQSVTNSILSGFPIGIRLESANCENYYLNTKEINLSHNILSNNGKLFDSTSVQTKTVSDQFNTENRTYNSVDEVKMTNPYGAKPVATLQSGSPALTGSDFTNLDVFFQRTAHVGAFDANDWTDCWAEYDPVNADYSFAPLQYFREDADFTNNTSNNVTIFSPNLTGNYTYSWDFGDGSALDNRENPVHSYAASGNYNVKLQITNSRGCVKLIEHTINVTLVSTNQSQDIEEFTIYPNPNHGICKLQLTAHRSIASRIDLIDGLGRTLHSQSVLLTSGENQIILNPVQVLSKGNYAVRVITDEGFITKLVLVL